VLLHGMSQTPSIGQRHASLITAQCTEHIQVEYHIVLWSDKVHKRK